MKKHSFTIWTWEQTPDEVFFLSDDGRFSDYRPNYALFKRKPFGKRKKFGIFPMRKYRVTIEAADNLAVRARGAG